MKLFQKIALMLAAFLLLLSSAAPAMLALAAEAPPQILAYQGRLANGSGDLLGSSSGTTYYFKFSLWNNASVGSGSRVWPASAPTATSATVRQGVFAVNIGDTANGYPDALNIRFADYSALYLQIEVSSDNSTFETLSPRQRLTAASFAQSAASVTGLGASALGTTTERGATATIAATSSAMSALALYGASSQTADLFSIWSSAFSKLFFVDAGGAVFGSSTLQIGGAVQFYDSLKVAGTASSTNLIVSSLGSSAGECLTITSSGQVTTTPCSGSGSSFSYPFPNNATSTAITFNASTTLQNFTAQNSTSTNATTTNLFATTASSTNLFASNFTFSNVTGFLKATAGAVATALVDLAADVTGILPVGNGGTGWAAVQSGALLYGNGSSALATTSAGTAGNVLALLNGVPTWTASTTFTSPLSYSQGAVSLAAASASTNGYLSSDYWSVFNNKISSTSLSAGDGISYNSSTGVISSLNGWPFSPTTNYGAATNATTSAVWFQNGLQASSTARFVYASTTALTTSGSAYFATASGAVGIATSTPWGKLSVTNADSGPSFVVEDSASPDTTPFVVDASGNVGIGSTTPSAKLSIRSAGSNTRLLAIANSTDTERLTILDSGRTGISTTSPNSWLTVSGNNSTQATFWVVDVGGFDTLGRFDVLDSGGVNIELKNTQNSWFVEQSLTEDFTLRDNSGTYFTILDTTGNIGIGTTTPGQKLSVAGDVLGNNFIGSYFTATTSTASAFPYASSTALTVSGTGYFGTASTSNLTVSGLASTLLSTNSSGAAQSTTVSSPLSFSGSTLSILTASASQAGALSSADWSVFNNKISSSSLSAGDGISYNSSTGVISNTIGYPFVGNATSTGLGIYASTTIGSGTRAGGLTVSGGATTTGTAYFAGSVGVGTTSPGQSLSVAGDILGNQFIGSYFTGTSTTASSFAGAVNTSGTTGGYKIDSNLVLYASSTNHATLVGQTGSVWTTLSSLSYTTAVGYQTLNSASLSGTQNTAVGWRALFGNTTGGNNTAVGVSALQANTTGASNTAFGISALLANISGSSNMGIGSSALSASVSGSNNVGIGANASKNNVSATSTVAIGSGAATGATGFYAQGYTAIGQNSGFSFTAGADYNTLIGYQTGYNITSGTKNIFLGAFTTSGNANITTGSNNIVIGNDTQAASATASDQLNIQNIIYGVSNSGSGSTVSTGNIGIGTTSPYAKFSVAGQGVFNRDLRADYYTATSTSVASTFPYASSTALTVSGTGYFDTASTSNLTVSSLGSGAGDCLTTNSSGVISTQACASFSYLFPSNATTTNITFSNGLTASALLASANDSGALGASGTAWSDLFLASGGVINWNAGDTALTHSANQLTFSGASSGYVFSDGNVGIGLSSNIDSPLTFAASSGEKINLYRVDADNMYGFGISGGQLNYHTGSASDDHVFFGGGDNGDGTELLRIKGGGNVGVGTTTPGQKFSVAGAGLFNLGVFADYFLASSTSAASSLPYASSTALTATSLFSTNAQIFGSSTIGGGTQITGLTVSGGATTTGTAYFAGSVGVGTNAPSKTLEVVGTASLTDSLSELSVSNAAGTIVRYSSDQLFLGNNSYLTMGGASTYIENSNADGLLRIKMTGGNGVLDLAAGSVNGYTTFATANTERARLTSSGYFGIGTTSPYAMLSVAGQAVAAYFTATTSTASSLPYASSTALTVSGIGYFGTASTSNLTVSGLASTLLSTNSSGAAQSTTVSSPLSFSGSTLSILTASASQAGALSSADWSVFNNKISSSSLSSANELLTYNSTTGVLTASSSPTFTKATTTALTVSGTAYFDTASTSNLTVSGLGSGAGNCLTPNSSGVISTQSCANFAFPYTPTTNYGAAANATTSRIWFQNGLQASSTSYFVYASSTALTVSGSVYLPNTLSFPTVGASSFLIRAGNHSLTLTSAGATNVTFPSGTGTLAGLSTAQTFSAHQIFSSLFATNASSTNATTTGRAYFADKVGIGVAVPSYSLEVNGDISINMFSGYKQAGTTILTASSTGGTTFVGADTGRLFVTGTNRSTGVGYQALYNATTSSTDSVAVGYQALYTLTGSGGVSAEGTTNYNTAVGTQALYSNSSGSSNTGVGYQSLYSNTNAYGNTGMGFYSLRSNTIGVYNTAIGRYALQSTITGSNNTALGNGALQQNTSATSSVAIGSNAALGAAAYYNQGGVYVGYGAGQSAGNGSDYNTLVGYLAGYAITTGQYNLLLGYDSGGSRITTGSNNILLGKNVSNGITNTSSNQLNIGNLIFGTSLGEGSTISTGKVGIGVAPSYTLDVNGDVNVSSGSCFRVAGVCIGYVKRLAGIYATSTPGSNVAVTKSVAGLAFSAGALTIPASTTEMVVEVWGSGAGGGGGSGTNPYFTGGGGGGAGGYAMELVSSPSGTYYYTVGAGGGGGSGAAGSGSTGSSGNTSCFQTTNNTCSSGELAEAAGGSPGSGGLSTGSLGVGGAGGAGSIGDVVMQGQSGSNGARTESSSATGGAGGLGGAAPRGGGGGAGGVNGAGTAGNTFGGGGGGASNNNTGGQGGSGGIVITVYATSSPTSAGNDYAEMFPVSAPGITAGDIVAVDAGAPISMTLAEAGSTHPLAGIVATNPGQLLGDINASGERPIALAGRVPTKVNLENGTIKIGDRIAPSSVAGVGKKAGPLDASVGIALEDFGQDDPDGMVMVFINLQDGVSVEAVGRALTGDTATSTEPFDFIQSMLAAVSTRLFGPLTLTPATSTEAATTTEEVASSTPAAAAPTPVERFFSGLFERIAGWLADAANGIVELFAKKVTTEELCVADSSGEKTCITKQQLDALLAGAALAPSGGGEADEPAPEEGAPQEDPAPQPEPESAPQEEGAPEPEGEPQIEEAPPAEEPASEPAPEPTPEPTGSEQTTI